MKNKSVAFCFLFMFVLVSFALEARSCGSSSSDESQGNKIEVLIGGKPFTTYYFDPAIAKAYLQPLRSAQGTIVTRGYPIGEHDSGGEFAR